MNERLFVDLHILQTVPPSCINRDDTGSPKMALYGGVNRARVSSQAWKKAVRDMFWGKNGEPLLDESKLGQRTKEIIELVSEQVRRTYPDLLENDLSDKVRDTINLASEKASKPIIPPTDWRAINRSLDNAEKEFKETDDVDGETDIAKAMIDAAKIAFPEDFNTNIDDITTIKKAKKTINDYLKKYKGAENEKSVIKQLEKKLLESPLISHTIGATGDALFFMGIGEAKNIADLVAAWIRSDTKPGKNDVLNALNQNKNNRSHAVDVALFGRMVAKAPALNTDASCQVAHAISTHKVLNEFDFFTALDDLKKTQGAAMMGTSEYNSSTLYRYATIAVHDLKRQLGNKTAAVKAVRAFTDAFTRSMPTGKINTFGNHILPDAIYVAIRQDQPLNLVGAFEHPIPEDNEGYVEKSTQALVKKANDSEKWIAPPLASFAVSELMEGIKGVVVMESFGELLSRMENEVEEVLQ